MKARTAAKMAFGVAIIAAMLFMMKLDKAATAIGSMDLLLFASAALLVVPLIFSAFIRWKLLLSSSKVDVGFMSASRIYLIGMFFSFITPSKIGSLVKFYFLKKIHGTPAGIAFSLSLMDKMFDLSIVLLISVIGIIFFSGVSGSIAATYSAAFVLVACAIFCIPFFSRGTFMRIMPPVISKFSFAGRFFRMGKIDANKAAADIYEPFGMLGRKKVYMTGIIVASVAYWMVFALQLMLLSMSFGFSLDILSSLFIVCISSAVAFIPITVGGIGTRDAALVYLLSVSGVLYEQSILISIFTLLITQFVMVVIGGLVYISSDSRCFHPA